MALLSKKENKKTNTLKKDIISRMPRLNNFTFNICSVIRHRVQTNFPLNEDIQKTFEHFQGNQIITCIDHFKEDEYSQCHIYSYPYKLSFYKNITNNFQAGLFPSVTEVSLYDERLFEYEFFVRIAESFPFMKQLIIYNSKPQKNIQSIKSNNDDQMLSIIAYPNLIQLDLTAAHDDYVDLFLFGTNVSLSNNLRLWVDYQTLVRVTHNYTRNTT